ncbi:MAG: chalcone isomerase family protein [Coraliomargaritaceae bacterium]
MYFLRLLLGLAFFATSLHAGTSTTPEPKRKVEVVGQYKYLHHGIFKVYEATVLAPLGVEAIHIISADRPFELRFHYLRNIKKQTILQSANRMLEKNLDVAQLQAISRQISELHEIYTDVKKGDRAILRYHPQTGTTFYFNEQPRLTLPGKDFAKYYFSIWFGRMPVSENMREALLGR